MAHQRCHRLKSDGRTGSGGSERWDAGPPGGYARDQPSSAASRRMKSRRTSRRPGRAACSSGARANEYACS
eukprot:4391365-Lingulodinium_polyedra.AAC.1